MTTLRKVRTSRTRTRRHTPGKHTLTGHFQMHTAFHSRILQNHRNVLVYLPPDYAANPFRRYPVFYMQDGQNLFDGATSYIPGVEWEVDETAERLIRNRKIEPVIIVGIYNTGVDRIDEYTPTRDPKVDKGGKANLYGRFLVEELKPFIDHHYRTLPDRHHTAVGGSSLGGLVSMYLGLKYPQVFGKLAVMSPSFWWDHQIIVESVRKLSHKPSFRIWLDMGTKEGPSALHSARRMRDALHEKGFHQGQDLHYREAKRARHGERAWRRRVSPMLQFLFPPQRKS
ncbi:MAG: alpha/beta hydrolase [Blastocatellia bacterium]|nr:alpha/beta hydrolase [Blastocatellia bacterium]